MKKIILTSIVMAMAISMYCQMVKPYERKIFPAEKDNEFDLGSKVTIETLTNIQKENLKKVGLIWGFLKYYHPNIARGDYNWDYELFRILPKILAAGNKKICDDVLVKWVSSLGQFSDGKELKEDAAKIKFKPDLDWIKAAELSGELSSLLVKVKNANRPKEHYYIAFYENIGNPDFKNEKEYLSVKYPDVGFRLLSLFRYWNIIQYYFPYKNLIEGDWKKVLENFITKIIDAKNETEYTITALELIAKVHDTHATIWGGNPILARYLGENYAAVVLSFIENKAVVTGYYDRKLGKETGLEIGDIILTVNARPVEQIVKESLNRTSASNYPTQLRDIALNLLRTNDSTITIEFSRGNKKEGKIINAFSTKTITIYRRAPYTDTSFKLINKNIAYLNNGAIKRKDLGKIWGDIKNTKGLIIDDRNYPSDFPIYELSNYLLPDSSPFAKFSNGSIEYPGLFTFTEPVNVGKNNKDYYRGKVVVLINEITQSSAEFHAMAYRVHPNVTVIGSTTAGADGNISVFSLPGGIKTSISGIGVYYPNGKETQRIGIVPDIEVKPTIAGVRSGRDELLEKAIEIINKQ